MRASRLLTILMLLQSRGRMTAPALAEALEVSVRTLYRDIDELSAAGVPVYAERGREGGFQLMDGWRTRLTGLTEAEAQAIFLAGLPGPAAELGLGEAMAMAELKLLAALPAGWQAEAQRVSQRFHLDPVGWFCGPARTDRLQEIADAVWHERRISMRYESWTGVVERVVEPLGIVLKAGTWYLVAAALGKPRTYRLGAIQDLAVTGENFERPADFDLAQHWEESTRRFESEIYRATATLRVSPMGMRRLAGFGDPIAPAAASTAGPPDEAGWVRVAVPIESVDNAAWQMLRLGAEAEVLEPAGLRERMAETGRQLCGIYVTPEAP